MKLVSLSLPLAVVCSDSCDSEFSSALQTRGRTSVTTPCIAVDRGAIAPTAGTFHSLDGSFEAEEVHEGAVAPVAGKFCVASTQSALLERARLTATGGGKVESSMQKKKEDFALKELGPFSLVARDELAVTLTEDAWSVGQSQGGLARTLQLDDVASYSWLGAKDISWAYQPDTEAAPDAGSFEKYGGFVLQNSAGEIQHVLEIDNFAAADEIEMTLEFSDPFSIKEKHWKKCQNPAPVTIPFLMDQGAMEYCWATSHSQKACENGCFLYKTKVGDEIKYQGFSVMTQYPLKALGPFPLHSRADLVGKFTKKKNKQWSLTGGQSGRLAATQALDEHGSNFWQQAVELDWAYQSKDTTQDQGPFEQYGGFVLLGGGGEVMDIMEIGGGGGEETMSLSFSDPFWISKKQWKKCSNPAPITISALSDLGATEYCWFTDANQCEQGCFYYNTVAGYMAFSARGFALPSLGPFPLVVRDNLASNLRLADGTWEIEGGTGSGQLGSTLELEGEAKNFWFGSDEVDWAFQNHEASNATGNFEKYGGFILKTAGSATHAMEIDVLASAPDMTLHFTEPFHITPQVWSACKNPAPITINALSEVGALEYCWEIGATCPNGCFLYKTTSGYQAFAAAKDFDLDSIGPFQLIARSDLLNKSEFPTLIAGQELLLDTDAEKQFWLDAVSVTWMFPKGDLERADAVGGFEKYGGFLLKDADNQVTHVLELDNFAAADQVVLTLNFDPMHIPAAKFNNCLNRRAVTIQSLVEKGVQEYCWEGSTALESCQFGCFLYMTSSGYQAFSIGSG